MSTAAAAAVHVERRGRGVARVVLDRPPVNVLDLAALDELDSDLQRVAADPEVRLVVLTGAGKAFCAGLDVADHLPERVDAMLDAFRRVVGRLLSMEAPVVAAINGAALGGGCELVLACDVVLARGGVRMGVPEVKLGAIPPVAAALLPGLVGRQRALDLILTGETVTAEDAERIGLVTRALSSEPGEFEAGVEAYVGAMAALSRPVLRLAKRTTAEAGAVGGFAGLVRAEAAYRSELMPLEDAREGIEAFLEKRAPVWRDA